MSTDLDPRDVAASPSADPTPPADPGPQEPLEVRVKSVDAFLGRWRQETVVRRAAWDEVAERAEAERQRRLRQRLVGAAITALTLGVVVGGWAISQLSREAMAHEAAAPDPAFVARPSSPPPEPAYAVGSDEPAPPSTVSVETEPAAPPPAELPPPPPPELASGARTWVQGRLVWTEFRVPRDAEVRIAWFDAAGVEVLERMGCGAVEGDQRRCTAGRSADRVGHALAAGAAPGEWTVRACGAEGCAVVGSFSAPW